MNITRPEDHIIVALDDMSFQEQLLVVKELGDSIKQYKHGLEQLMRRQALLASALPQLSASLSSHFWAVSEENREEICALNALDYALRNKQLFWDEKFHDIGTTVRLAMLQCAPIMPWMINIHCLGGSKMMREAVKAKQILAQIAEKKGMQAPLLMGVTILTTHTYEDLVEMSLLPEINITDPVEAARVKQERLNSLAVRHLGWLAKENGLDGIICSPQELSFVREYLGPDMLTIVPGIRPLYAQEQKQADDDQARIMTPGEAVRAGADLLVIGRPITQAQKYGLSRQQAVALIAEDIARVEQEAA